MGWARRAARRRAELHGAAHDRRHGRSHRTEWSAVRFAPRARSGILARHRAHATRQRRAQARRGAHQGARLQRRAQASEGGGSALPLLGGSSGAARVGGDAECVPVHEGIGGAGDDAVDGGSRSRLQSSVHCRVGAVQRELGRAGSAGARGAAALRARSLPSHEDDRQHAARGGERRMGARGDGHCRDPRLRGRSEEDQRALRHGSCALASREDGVLVGAESGAARL